MCSIQMAKQSELEECTAVQECTLTASVKALIFVAHQITSVTNGCHQSSVS